MQELKVFAAYPSTPPVIQQIIAAAKLKLPSSVKLADWMQVDNWGKELIYPILMDIDRSNFLLADITRLNFNVTFEIGYAIARKKRILLVCNTGIENDAKSFNRAGVFDTLGYKTYENSDQLASLFESLPTKDPIKLNQRIDRESGNYLVDVPSFISYIRFKDEGMERWQKSI